MFAVVLCIFISLRFQRNTKYRSILKVSGGLHNDMAVHDFDIARFLVGCEVAEVYCKGSCKVDPEIGDAGDIDTSLAVLTFKNGVVVTVDNCRKATYGYDQRVEVFGSKVR